MPNIPRAIGTVSPGRQSSVGRLRVDAPVEAFGGGAAAQGLAQVGRGLQSMGAGAQRVGQRQEQEQAYSQRSTRSVADAAAKEEAKRLAAMKKLRKDRLSLTYNQGAQKLTNELESNYKAYKEVSEGNMFKDSPGRSPTMSRSEFLNHQLTELKKGLLSKEDFDDVEKEGILIEWGSSDIKRTDKAALSDNREAVFKEEQTTSAIGDNISTTMRDNHSMLSSENINEWFNSFSTESIQYYDRLISKGYPKERAKQMVDERRTLGFKAAIEEKMTNIPTSTTPTSEVESIFKVLEQVPASIMSDKDKQTLKDDMNKMSKARIKQLGDQKVKASNLQLDEFAASLANMDNDYDRDTAFTDFATKNPDLRSDAKTIVGKYNMTTPLATELKLSKALGESRNPEKFKESLLPMLKGGEISAPTYKKYIDLSKSKMGDMKLGVYHQMMSRLKSIQLGVEEGTGGKGELARTGGMDIKVNKQLFAAVDTLKTLAFTDNVTHLEFKQVMDDILFAPEAKMMAKSLEERVFSGRKMLLEAAQEPGTQNLDKAKIESWNKARNKTDKELREDVDVIQKRLLNRYMSKQEAEKAKAVEETQSVEAQQELEWGL